MTRRGQWWVTWALLFGVIAIWSLSGPLFSGPDEPSHVAKAAAVARGVLVGTDRRFSSPTDPGGTWTIVRIPEIFDNGYRMPECYKFRPQVAAGCSGAFTGSDATGEVPTFSGHYPPLYFAIVGLPTLLLASAKGVILMRLLGAAVSAALLASALSSASSSRHRTALILAVAFAMTPMVLFTASVVNPSALEISAALCVWVSTLVLVDDPAGAGRRLVARIGVSGALLTLSRGLSPLWLLVIAVVALATSQRAALVTMSRRRDVRLCAVGLVVATGLATAWILLAGALDPGNTPQKDPTSLTGILRLSLGDTDYDLRVMIGRFGWLDIEAPALTRYVWFGVVGGAVLGAFAVGRRRYVVALAILMCSVVVLPVVLETLVSPQRARFWSGRYTLPLAVGIPPLAAMAIADRMRRPPEVLWRLAAVLLGALAVGHVLAYAAATRRYAVGTAGPVMYVLDGGGWRPPVPAWALLAGFVAGVAALATWLQRLAVGPVVREDHAPAPPADGTPRQGRPTAEV